MKKQSLLIIGLRLPEPNTTAAGTRMLQLIQLFIKWEYDVTFASTSIKWTQKNNDLKQLPINWVSLNLNSEKSDDFFVNLNPTIVLFDQFIIEEQFGWKISKLLPKTLKILDTEDLHFLREARSLKYFKKTPTIQLKNNLAKREIASIYRCDLSLIISEFELNLLVTQFKIDKTLLFYLPFLVNPIKEKSLKELPSFKIRKDFMAIGNFKHKPNYDAVVTLKKIWPKIAQKIPKANLHIYGSYADEKILKLSNPKQHFFIESWAANKKDAFSNHKVCLAPLNFGAGLKGKLIDSMLFGTPNITTSIGAEGMMWKNCWNGFIENDYNIFIEKAIALYTDEEIWIKSQLNGIKIINNLFDPALFEENFRNTINNFLRNLDKFRNTNFIGLMMQHHRMSSTTYLSKYIQEKNKKNN
ncbi:MAG: glycosyltransferase [Lutibacter sp.]